MPVVRWIARVAFFLSVALGAVVYLAMTETYEVAPLAAAREAAETIPEAGALMVGAPGLSLPLTIVYWILLAVLSCPGRRA